MGYDPKEPRDKSGKWSGGASGHNAGGGNRVVAKHIASQHKGAKLKVNFLTLPPHMQAKVDAHNAKVASHPNFRVVDENSKLTADEIAQVRHAARSLDTNPHQTIRFKSPAAYARLRNKYVASN